MSEQCMHDGKNGPCERPAVEGGHFCRRHLPKKKAPAAAKKETRVEEGECEHGKPYLYKWTWDAAKGETIESSEPVIVEHAACDRCYPDDF